jgi:hypothetical protein
VNITVTTASGTSATGPAGQYSYVYPFTGFLAPVDNPPAINMVHAGQAIPIQFSLGSNQGLNIIAAGYPTAQQVSCTTGAPTPPAPVPPAKTTRPRRPGKPVAGAAGPAPQGGRRRDQRVPPGGVAELMNPSSDTMRLVLKRYRHLRYLCFYARTNECARFAAQTGGSELVGARSGQASHIRSGG